MVNLTIVGFPIVLEVSMYCLSRVQMYDIEVFLYVPV